MQVKDSVCFVSGSNRGIGRAIVEALIQKGAAKVYASARNPTALKALVDESNGKVVALQLDVTNEEQIQAAARITSDTQILFNNAGIAIYTGVISAPDSESARAQMEVNYFGLMNMTRAFAPVLRNNGGGVLVNISSIAGLVGIPAMGTYGATKAAIHSLTQSIRGELSTHGTQVIGVYPGPVKTDMTAGLPFDMATPQQVAQQILNGIETGAEEVYPDKMALDFVEKLKSDAKGLEKAWAGVLPQPVEA
ncbi:MAG: SDR family oxidoreductase [Anaerolineae bacterium]|nr:SDR family oxidoreductase [Anaerolineae bacterium]